MQTFVVNLQKDTARLSHMAQQLEQHGISWTRFNAVNKSVILEIGKELGWPIFLSGCSPAELGCSFSHYSIWRQILEEDLPYALVLEDDVVFAHDAGIVLSAVEEFASKNTFDIIKLETFLGGIEVSRAKYLVGKGSHLSVLHGNHAGCAAYFVSNSGCQRLVSHFPEFRHAIDLEMFEHRNKELSIYQLEPAIFVQDIVLNKGRSKFESNIEGSRLEFEKKHAVIEALKDPFRKLSRMRHSLRLAKDGKRKIASTFSGG